MTFLLARGPALSFKNRVGILFRKREIECCAFVDFTFRPNFASVAPDDPVNGRQSYPCSSKLSMRVQPLERTKKLGGVFRVEPGAVIAHEIDRFSALLYNSELDLRPLFFRGEF